MKLKKLSAIILSMCILLTQCLVSVYAETVTPNGDWMELGDMLPDYEVTTPTNIFGPTVLETEKQYGDFIMEFEAVMPEKDARIKPRKGNEGYLLDMMQNDWLDSATRAAKRYARQQINGYGFISTDGDADWPAAQKDDVVKFRVQVRGGTISLWAADVSADSTDTGWKYGGKFTDAKLNTKDTVELYATSVAVTVNSFKVYNISADMTLVNDEVSPQAGENINVEFSSEPSRTPEKTDFILKDSAGNVVDGAIESVSGSGVQYTLVLGKTLNFGEEYTLNVANTLTTAQGFGFSGTSFTTGCWVELDGIIPDYEVTTPTNIYGATVLETEKQYGDFIMEFEAVMPESGARIKPRKGNEGYLLDMMQSDWLDSATRAAKRYARQQINGYGFISTDGDADWPAAQKDDVVKFRVQVRNGTISLWSADVSADSADTGWKYGGKFTDAKLNTTDTVELYATGVQLTVNSFKVYDFDGTAEVTPKDNKNVSISFSERLRTLSPKNILFTDSFGKSIIPSAVVYDEENDVYNVTADLEYGVNYSVTLPGLVASLGGSFTCNSFNIMEASVDEDFNDNGWKDYFGIYASKNINNNSLDGLCKNGEVQLQGGYGLITKNEYPSNAIIEFEAEVTEAHTNGYLFFDTGLSNYVNGSAQTSNRWWLLTNGNSIQTLIYKDNALKKHENMITSNAVLTKNLEEGIRNTYRVKTLDSTVSYSMKPEGESDFVALGSKNYTGLLNTNDGRLGFYMNGASNSNGEYCGAIYDNIKVYELDSKAEAILADGIITLSYSVEPEAAMSAADFAVTDSNGNAVAIEKATRKGSKVYEIDLGCLKKGETYTISTAKKNIYGANIASASVTAIGYSIDGSTATFTDAETVVNANLIWAVYNGDALSAVKAIKTSDLDENNSYTFDAINEGDVCKIFVWDSFEKMTPVIK